MYIFFIYVVIVTRMILYEWWCIRARRVHAEGTVYVVSIFAFRFTGKRERPMNPTHKIRRISLNLQRVFLQIDVRRSRNGNT